VDKFHQRYVLILITVSGNNTIFKWWSPPMVNEPQPEFDRKLRLMLQDWGWNDAHQGVGVVFYGPKFPDAADRTTIVSRVCGALQAGSMELVVHEMKYRVAACLGLNYDSRNQEKQVIAGRSSYPIYMATASDDTHPENSIRLSDRHVKLPRHASVSLSPSLNEHNGVLLRFLTNK
jgi:hypothetical protein